MESVLSKLNEVLDVTRSLATRQQGRDKEGEQEANEDTHEANEDAAPVNNEIPEANLRNPYETGKMAKSNVAKVVLGKQTLKQKSKNLKEVTFFRKGNVSSGSGKGKVNIISEHGDDLNPKLSKSELEEQMKRDKQLDELIALKEKIEVEEAA
ncbi:unnamed protein product [Lactuca virosa]|uniref:Uncharacterized protein n=1 Tax=Lactuca virosa TaxID=75947 RepID=A0AAU9LI89_9ASTR|nr:unnamed protein product [Lactuca virosa]